MWKKWKRYIREMAKGAEVSEATVIRMLKAVGYKSFKEIKIAFVEERMKKKEIDEANRGILGISMKKGDKLRMCRGGLFKIPSIFYRIPCRLSQQKS